MHHNWWLLVALLPLGAMLWWAVQSLREISVMQRQAERLRADLQRRHPWLRTLLGKEERR